MFNEVFRRMVMIQYNMILLFVSLYLVSVTSSAKEPLYYVSTEHINVTYINPEYFAFFHATAARPGRWDLKYYVHFHLRTVKTMDNNITMDFIFYEFRSNEYRRGFVEMHMAFCDMVLKDNFFGPAVRANLPECPLPPDEYRMTNMSIPDLPLLRTFPFRKGRIYLTASLPNGARAGAGYIDMEIKMRPAPRQNRTKATNASLNNTSVAV